MTQFDGNAEQNSDTQETYLQNATPTDSGAVANAQPADDAVGTSDGPEVVTTVPDSDSADVPAPFDGTVSVEDRAEADAATEAVQADNAADTAAVAAAQGKADQDFRTNNPDVPVVRAANPNVGGESFRA